jgi:TIR domain
MLHGYSYHYFISYSRSGDAGKWVHNHFFPVLKGRLEAILGEPPALFIDQDIEVGSAWPQKLADALHQSRCMVAVWTPSYFRSPWCVAEWETVLERERRVGLKMPGNCGGLVYPVVYSNGDSFPSEAKQTQSRFDFREYAYPYKQFTKTMKYLTFFDKVSELAEQLKRKLDTVPDWDATWPTLRPSPNLPMQPQFVRL